MLNRLGPLGILAFLVFVGCLVAAYTQRSVVALVVAGVAGIFMLTRLLRSADA